MPNIDPLSLILRAPVVIFSLVLHEFMHGWVAWKCGDETALKAGRLTFNPLAHLDIVGTICLFFAPIGWAKPVPVNPLNLRNPRRDDILVSGAGVTANFALAVGLCLLARFLTLGGILPETEVGQIAWAMMGEAIILNFGLTVFNLLPIPPLDGSHIMRNLLPLNAAIIYAQFSQYGFIVLLGVVLLAGHYLLVPIIYLMLGFAGLDASGVMLDYMQKFHM